MYTYIVVFFDRLESDTMWWLANQSRENMNHVVNHNVQIVTGKS